MAYTLLHPTLVYHPHVLLTKQKNQTAHQRNYIVCSIYFCTTFNHKGSPSELNTFKAHTKGLYTTSLQ
jgi:hypothetical protein